jgi:hypothetical protein
MASITDTQRYRYISPSELTLTMYSLVYNQWLGLTMAAVSFTFSQQQHTQSCDNESDDACINWDGSVHHQERPAQQRCYHPSSEKRVSMMGIALWDGATYTRDSAEAIPHAVPRTKREKGHISP